MSVPLDDLARDLLKAKNYAHVSVVRRDGTVQTAVVWVDVDEHDHVIVNSATGRGWPNNLRRTGAATVSVHSEESGYAYTSIETRLLEARTSDGQAVIDALSRKYTGEDYPAGYDAPGSERITLVLEPVRVTSYGV
jgi:PPOX class probable F420-dependent enzyme